MNGIEEMKKHPFFQTINFPKLFKRELQPPFKPAVVQTDDVFYFDKEFTSKTPKGMLQKIIHLVLKTLNCVQIHFYDHLLS